jgi:peptidoglycan-associated lipoprotein
MDAMLIHRRLSLLALTVGLAAALLATGCPDSYPDCNSDETCVEYNRDSSSQGHRRNHQYCIDGSCRECRSDGNCGACQECNGNVCETVPGCCSSSADCPSGQICQNNRCEAGCDATRPCTSQCQTCSNNRCVDIENCCVLNSDCQSGYRCENNRCVPDVACADGRFETIYFDFDESVIRADQESRLEHNAACMNLRRDAVRIEGHCDERGTDAYNLALGERRARSSKRFMERLGVVSDRMDIISYGESRPVCRQSNESCWRQNRRSEFVWR